MLNWNLYLGVIAMMVAILPANSTAQTGNGGAIDIRKQAEGPDSRVFAPGANVNFSIVVANHGSSTLFDVRVEDPLVPNCDRTFATVGVGSQRSYVCTAFNVTTAFTNEACASGTFDEESTAEDCDTSAVEIQPAPIPTLGPWGLVALMLMLLGLAVKHVTRTRG